MFEGINLSNVDWAVRARGRGIRAYSQDVYIQRYRSKNGEKKRYCIYLYNGKGDLFKTERIQMGVIGNLLLMRDSAEGFKLSPRKTLQTGTRTTTFVEGYGALDKWLDAHLHQSFDMQYDPANKVYYIQG